MSLAGSVLRNDVPEINRLLADGADVNEVDDRHEIPLILAVKNRRIDMLCALLNVPSWQSSTRRSHLVQQLKRLFIYTNHWVFIIPDRIC